MTEDQQQAAARQPDPAEALLQREQAVAKRERGLTARAEVSRLGLPQNVADALDVSSDQALESGLRLIKLLSGLAQPPAPKAHTAPPPAGVPTYRHLADLYRTDPYAYRQRTHETKIGGQQ